MASLKTRYLFIYNSVFASLWFGLFIRILATNPFSNHDNTYAVVGNFAKGIQTTALLDVLHAAISQWPYTNADRR